LPPVAARPTTKLQFSRHTAAQIFAKKLLTRIWRVPAIENRITQFKDISRGHVGQMV
jgi:hypothetical protein